MSPDVDLLVVGESVIDRVRGADGRLTGHPGGSPANVAYGLGRLGRRVAFLTELGTDDGGLDLRRHLTSAGVLVEAHPVARTPSATATLDARGAAVYDFDLTWSLASPPADTVAGHLHVGSLGAYLTPGADTVEAILRARHDVATISFDPNLRPQLLGDPDEVRRRTRRLLVLSDVVKASDDDLACLWPGRDPLTVAREWLDSGPAVVVVTRGADGCTALTRAGRIDVPAVPAAVADTVGAGDSFMAALLDGLGSAGLVGRDRRTALRAATTADLRPALQRAARAAAITVSRTGARPPTSDELVGPAGSRR